MATVDQIGVIFNALTTNYGYIQRDKKPEDMAGLLDIWKQTLSDIDGDLLRLAALKIISTSKWFPSVAELRGAALDISEPNHCRTGIEAWGDVIKAFHNVGIYSVPKFNDPVVANVVRLLGWQALCASEDQTADRARFIDGYNSILANRRNDALMLPEVKQAMQQIGAHQDEARAEIKKLTEALQ